MKTYSSSSVNQDIIFWLSDLSIRHITCSHIFLDQKALKCFSRTWELPICKYIIILVKYKVILIKCVVIILCLWVLPNYLMFEDTTWKLCLHVTKVVPIFAYQNLRVLKFLLLYFWHLNLIGYDGMSNGKGLPFRIKLSPPSTAPN